VKLIAVLAVGVLSLGMVGTAAAAATVTPSSAGKASVYYAVDKPLCAKPAAPDGIRCFALRRVQVAESTPGAVAYSTTQESTKDPAGDGGLTPAALATAYHVNPASPASSQTVGLVDWFNDPHALHDLNHFDSYYGLHKETSTSFRQVNQKGASTPLPRNDADSAGEIALDIETVRGLCHTCKIVLVEASDPNGTDLAAAENEAVTLGATEVSNSWGGPEEPVSSSFLAAFNHPGVVITASTGDDGWLGWDYANGSSPGEDDTEGVASFPSTDPDVIAVGGTTLDLNSSSARTAETVWNGNGIDDKTGRSYDGPGGASGGGCSTLFKAPAWQLHYAGYAAAGCDGMRLDADISADADPNTGLDVYDTYEGGWITIGGTSLASPITAALFALAGGSGGATYPASTLYTNGVHDAGALYDVVTGGNSFCGGDTTRHCSKYAATYGVDNPNGLGAGVVDCSFPRNGSEVATPPVLSSECNAVIGYDGPSGLGTPNGISFFQHSNPSVRITDPSTVTLQKAASFTVTAKEPISGITVTDLDWNWGDGTTSDTTSPGITHTFTSPGTYTVSVQVTDTSYQLVRKTTSITVGEPASVKVSGPSTLKVSKNGSYSAAATTVPNTGAKIATVTWDWGDGKSSTGTSATHKYTKKGTYTISIVVLDSSGVTTKVTKSVKVG
jgi:subtilase family serine protease